MNLNDSIEQRALKNEALNALITLADADGRDFTEAEEKQFDALEVEIKAFDAAIKEMEEKDARKKRVAIQRAKQTPKKTPEAEVKERFSFSRAIRLASKGKQLDGVEGEMNQEARVEASRSGLVMTGQFGVPSFIKERALTVGSGTSMGNWVENEPLQIIDALRPRLMVEQLGATMMTGLVGNLPISRVSGVASGTWEGETDANAESTQTTDLNTLTPNRLGTFTTYSKQLLFQTNPSVENFVRQDLETAIAIAVDLAAINGSGASNQPTGILNTSGIGAVAIGTNGGALTRAHIIDLETAIAVDNADVRNMAYLTTPGVRGEAKQTLLDVGSGQFVWGQNESGLNGYRAEVTTQMPSTGTKGTGTALNSMILADWTKLIVANWAGLDIVVDNITLAGNANVKVYINSWWDVFLRHVESFAAVTDIDLTA